MEENEFYFCVTAVKPLEDYNLHLTFENGRQGIFDVKPYLEHGVFKELKDIEMFNTVRAAWGSIAWDNDVDIAPERLYEKSKMLD
jgi:hypothetical protein